MHKISKFLQTKLISSLLFYTF